MRTISQVAELTGISTRTLQYYDEIGLLKPSALTGSGYRLYDDEALQRLQQILFFKEFDLSDYIHALENFKSSQSEEVIKHWGSIANFDRFIQKVKDDESEIAKLAIRQFGSVEKYTEAMEYNLEHISEIMEMQLSEEAKEIAKQSDVLYGKLTADLSEDVSSSKIQSIVQEIWQFIQKNSTNTSISCSKSYMNMLIDAYSNDYIKSIADSKYKKGASDYIVKAFRYYLEHSHF